MARSIWSGTLSFGLVNVVVTLHPATKSKSLKFHFLNREDKHPINYQKVDVAEGKVLGAEDIVKGYEFEKGAYVVMEDSDFEAAEIKTGRSIDVVNFVKLEEVDAIYYQKAYYLAPTEMSIRAYDLLVRALEDEGKAAVVRFVLRNKQHLGLVRPFKGALMLETMFYADEVLEPSQIIAEHKVKMEPEELELAKMLINRIAAGFEPEKYKDEYRENLVRIIKEKIKGRKVEVPPAVVKKPVVDIMAALKESLEKAKRAA